MRPMIFRAAAAAGITALLALPAFADSALDQLQGLSPSQIQSALQSMPPQLRDQLRQQLQGKSTEDLLKMSPDQMRAAIEGLSPDMRAQLKSQWQSMSADQRAFLKSLNVRDLVEKIKAMTGPELAMLRHMVDKALGTAGPDNQP